MPSRKTGGLLHGLSLRLPPILLAGDGLPEAGRLRCLRTADQQGINRGRATPAQALVVAVRIDGRTNRVCMAEHRERAARMLLELGGQLLQFLLNPALGIGLGDGIGGWVGRVGVGVSPGRYERGVKVKTNIFHFPAEDGVGRVPDSIRLRPGGGTDQGFKGHRRRMFTDDTAFGNTVNFALVIVGQPYPLLHLRLNGEYITLAAAKGSVWLDLFSMQLGELRRSRRRT